MANVTFTDLPTRSKITKNDFFIINSSDKKSLPEGKVAYASVEKEILKGTIIDNYFLSKTFADKAINKKIDTFAIKTTNNQLFNFTNDTASANGFFQIQCIKTKGTIPTSTFGTYKLTWISSTNKNYKVQLLESDIFLNNTSKANIESNFHTLLIPPFNPKTTGYFELTTNFSANVNNAAVKFLIDMWVFQLGT